MTECDRRPQAFAPATASITKHPNTERVGGPRASHENAKEPEKSRKRGVRPEDAKSDRHSGISGGGGERDSHHTREPVLKGGRV